MKPQPGNAVRSIRAAILGGIAAIIWMTAALAAEPVAVVEDVSGQLSGVDFMDYVESGKVIKLGSRGRIVLGYLKSCWRETITGGTVTVGTEQSRVQSGSVERVRVKCDGGRMELIPEEAVESAGVISRSMGKQPDNRPKFLPQVTLYARIPMVDVRAGGTLLIERIDKPGERLTFTVEPSQLVRGAFYDFASTNWVLAAGGVYRVTLGAKQIVFKVDAEAPPMAPLASRLLRF
jgi:hypothetical protein